MGKTPIPAGSLPPLPEHLSNLVAGINALIAKFDEKYTDLQNAIDFMYAELDKVEATYAKRSIQIIAGTNLTGGGDLTANRTISLANASTSARGAVQLSTAVDSTSTTLAATPSAVKKAYDLAKSVQNGSGNYLGKDENAVSASKLQTARTIGLSGDASGSIVFDGTKNVTIPVTIANDSHSHVIGNVDGLQTALDGKLSTSGKAADSAKLEGKTKAEVIAEARAGTAKDATVLNTSDLDTIKTPGFYYQHVNANATSERHYPESNAGSLLVVKGAGVTQIYHVYNSSRVWTRSQYSSGAWTAWGRDYNTLNKPSKTDVGLGAVNNWPATSSVSDSSNSKYATAGAVKTAHDKADAAMPKSGGTFTGEVYNNAWYRSNGNYGWYNQTYGGGIYQTDSSWVQIYGSKGFKVNNQIIATGDITAFYSDARLKENIRPIKGALNAVLSWQGVRYNANELANTLAGYDRKTVHVGLLAQQVQKTTPEAVCLAPFDRTEEIGKSASGENYLTVKYERLVPVLVEAIREQAEQISRLEATIQQLGK